jgi:hypothetical protein
MPDQWAWRATYTDGSIWDELDEGGNARGFASVDLPRVESLAWVHTTGNLPDYVVRVNAASGQRPILFRRRTLAVNLDTGEQAQEEPVHVLGWQKTVQGVNVASYAYIFHDGSVLLSDDYKAV